MNRWRFHKRWTVIGSLSFLFGGLILYGGYQSSLSDLSPGIPQTITNEAAHVSSPTAQDVKTRGTNHKYAQQEDSAISLDQEHEFQEALKLVFGKVNTGNKPLELKDFPSPVHGKTLRNVGNYDSETFGDYRFHAGVDYAVLEGTVIRATHGGIVVFSGLDPMLGQKVVLECGEGWQVTYGNLDNLRVQEGEIIKTHTALGQVGILPGAESESGQPQLHYEVWHESQIQRPL